MGPRIYQLRPYPLVYWQSNTIGLILDASYWSTRMGFRAITYQDPEARSLYVVSHIVSKRAAILVLTGPIYGQLSDEHKNVLRCASDDRLVALSEIHEHLSTHGDGVKHIASQIAGDMYAVWKQAVDNGARAIAEPCLVAVVGYGVILSATIRVSLACLLDA